MRVGLLFGSFNPVHRGHIALADWILSKQFVDEIWIVVSPHNPMKQAAELADFDDRVAMVRLAIGGREHLRVETLENELPKPSYTYNTIVALRKLYSGVDFVILAGSDIAEQLAGWYRGEELQSLVDFMFYPRGEGDIRYSEELKDAPRWPVSASQVRDGGCEAMVERSVWSYIVLNNLYGMRTIENLSELIDSGVGGNDLAVLYFERGKMYYSAGNFGMAINDFRAAEELDGGMVAASEMILVCNSILDYRCTDFYNP